MAGHHPQRGVWFGERWIKLQSLERGVAGAVTVTMGASTLTSPQTYKVKPKITSFTPPSGSPATLVKITGTGLSQATTVKFGAVKATTFTVISDSEATAVVPSGLAAEAVKISITAPGGTASSPKEFTVNETLTVRNEGTRHCPGLCDRARTPSSGGESASLGCYCTKLYVVSKQLITN
jgi:hypothetical protein